jgi:tRNA threonylcarbamoyladenosine biosynthesis protein TsaE
MVMQEVYSGCAEETIAFGRRIGESVAAGAVICLSGDLGAGKTTLIKGIVSTLTEVKLEEVCSPTFGYLNIYEGRYPVYHFDLFRLRGVEDFLGLGFEEYLFSEGICCVEWSERIERLLPEHSLRLTLLHDGGEKRHIIYEIPEC